ncbi:hypothetical protein TNCV_4253091 [Trichonephila clavipes]|nr:hypothetical protein TNCV_4253091 [Trichonephila clavipes]
MSHPQRAVVKLLNVDRAAAIKRLMRTALHDRWRHHSYPCPQFRQGTREKGNILMPPLPVVCAATAHKTFGSTDLTSTYPVSEDMCWHRTQALLSGV